MHLYPSHSLIRLGAPNDDIGALHQTVKTIRSNVPSDEWGCPAPLRAAGA
jgi:hypothetical protein